MNMIELVTKYLPILDEQYHAESRSAILDMPAEFVQETKDAKKIKLAKIRSDKLGEYSRQTGFVPGYADLTWEEHTFTQDRGRSIQIDMMDNQETFGLAFGRLAGNFQRDAVIPEVDAYRFATYYKHAGTKKNIAVTAGAILAVIDDLDAQFDNDEVPENDRLLFVNPQIFKLMINDPQLTKHISVLDSADKTVNKKIYMYDNHMIIKVPQKRFYTAITTLDGKTAGQELGGYRKADDGEELGILMIQKDTVVQIAKRAIARIWAPSRDMASGTDGVNPDADAWKFDYRLYHDAWVLEEKIAGIAAVVCTGSGLGEVTIEPSEDTATYNVRKEGTTALVKGTIPYITASAGNEINLHFINSNITAKADLPTGTIAKVLKANGTYTELDSTKFEDDGSLKVKYTVNDLRVGAVKITWATGEEVTYVINTLEATLGANA